LFRLFASPVPCNPEIELPVPLRHVSGFPLSNYQVTLDFSRPGKPTDNPFIESFNGSFRDECLNVNWFLSLEDAKEKIRLFKEEYNGFRPHSAWSGLTPNEVVQQHSHGPIFSVLDR